MLTNCKHSSVSKTTSRRQNLWHFAVRCEFEFTLYGKLKLELKTEVNGIEVAPSQSHTNSFQGGLPWKVRQKSLVMQFTRS